MSDMNQRSTVRKPNPGSGERMAWLRRAITANATLYKKVLRNSPTVILKIGNYDIFQVIKVTVKCCFASLDYVTGGMCLFL